MPKQSNQKLKILYLMEILNEQTDEDHPMALPEILRQLETRGVKAERKSIYQDIEALRLFGMDIELARGRYGGYYVASRTFELAELKLLVDAVQSSRFITRKKSGELIKKVESLASGHEGRLLQRQVFIGNRVKALNEEIYYNIDTIHAAISGDRKIRFRYFEWTVSFRGGDRIRKQYRRGDEKYCISPWALLWEDDNYYMVGYDEDAQMIKHYRVDKMEKIDVTNLTRSGRKHFEEFDPAMYSRRVFRMYGGKEEDLVLRINNKLAGVVFDRFGQDIYLSADAEDTEHFLVKVRVAISPQFFSWLFGLGAMAEIISPESVREQYSILLEETTGVYAKREALSRR